MRNNRYKQTDIDTTPMNRIASILKSMDFRSWVVMLLMFLVLTAMMGLNAYTWTIFLPSWVAYILSGFMEAGALGWKVADERKENSDAQQQLATILVWVNVIMGVVLLSVNLVRSAFYGAEIGTGNITGWDIVAFILVALSALSHVAGALLFRQWDERLNNRRKIAKLHNKAAFDRDYNDGILGDLHERLELVEQVQNRIKELQDQYAHLPPKERDAIIRQAKNALEERYGIDADDDGHIGEPKDNKSGSKNIKLTPQTALAAETVNLSEETASDSFRQR